MSPGSALPISHSCTELEDGRSKPIRRKSAFEKFGQHQPLNRQAERYAQEGVPIALSTMADAVGSVCTALDPLLRVVETHVMAAERLHGDDTTVPVLAEGKTDTGRCWV